MHKELEEQPELSPSLLTALRAAVTECENEDKEERGGVIIQKDGNYEFIALRNMKAGTPEARGLWMVHPDDFGKYVVKKLCAGWKAYGSFHTHPSFTASPSTTDLNILFKGYSTNYIYSNRDKTLNKFTYYNSPKYKTTCWVYDEIKL